MKKYVECACQDVEHLVVIEADKDYTTISVQANPYLPFWHRVVLAFKYVFSGKRMGWDECLLNKGRVKELAEFLEETHGKMED